jgi:5-methylcytosine-specific restriction endonuclease McrA
MLKYSGRGDSESYDHLYDLSEWESLRRQTFQRDALICALCGRVCAGRYPSASSPVCDHIRPHRGALALFLDPGNLQTLCKSCHDSEKQGREVRGYSLATDATGWPLDPQHPANRRR